MALKHHIPEPDMRRFGLRWAGAFSVVLAVAVAMLLGACGNDGEDDDISRDDVEQEYNEAIDAMDNRIEEIDAEIEEATDEERIDLEDEREQLVEARDDAEAKLDEIADATEEELAEFRDDLDAALEELGDELATLLD